MKTVTTCGAIVRDESGKILILLRSATDVRRPIRWDLPGGHAESGETLEEALRRELFEETGMKLTGAASKLLHAFSATFDGLSVNWLFFEAIVNDKQVALSSEHSEFKWVNIDQAIELIDYEPKRRALVYIQENQLLEL